jgi:hypothetical protein
MWTTTKDLVKENLTELAQVKEKLAEIDQVKGQLVKINNDIEALRKDLWNSQKHVNKFLLAMKSDTVKCLDLLSSDDMVRRVENLKKDQEQMGLTMQEILRNVALLDDANRLLLANLLLKDMNV